MQTKYWNELADRNRRANTYLHNKYMKAADKFLDCPFWRIIRSEKLFRKSNYLYKIATDSSNDYKKFLNDWGEAIKKEEEELAKLTSNT